MAMVDKWSGLWSAVASFMFLWSMVKQHAPAGLSLRLATWASKVANLFNPYLEITINEYGGAERFRRSELFQNVETYLSDACARRARKLKAEFGKDSKKLQVAVDDYEQVTDTFAGAPLWWYASKRTQKTNVISWYPGEDERRYYRVVFHRRHRDLVVDSYLPYVQEEGRAVTVRNRQRRLFTNSAGGGGGSYRGRIWSHVPFEHPATFHTLAMDPVDKEAIVDDLSAFMEAKDYYAKVGKSWKRGYLLFGPPGTGKSTMIAAMANFLDYDVYDLELTAVRSNTELRKLFIETTGKSIIVIEDIDCSVDLTGKRRRDKKKTDDDGDDQATVLPIQPETDDRTNNQVTLSGLLNSIDGLWSACGGERIIVFTTNHVGKLDPALIRRGRMDKHIEMSYCSFQAFMVLAKNYLDITDHELFGEIRQLLQETDMTPADVAEKLMPMSDKKKRDPGACLTCLVEALNIKKKANKEEEAGSTPPKGVNNNGGREEEDDDDDWMLLPTKTSSDDSEKRVVPVPVAGVLNPVVVLGSTSPESDESMRPMCRAESGADKTTEGSQPRLHTDRGQWILGTTAWVHHTFNLRLLHDLTTRNLQEVADELTTAGEEQENCLPVLGHGSVRTERFRVPEVRYIQGESRNVISVAQLARLHGLVTVFEPTFGYVKDPATGQEVGRAHLSNNGTYVLDYLLIDQENGKEEEQHRNGGGGFGETGKAGETGGNGGGGRGDGGTATGGGAGAGSAATGAGGAGDDDGGREGEGRGSGGRGAEDGEEDDEEEHEDGKEEEQTNMQNNMFGLPKGFRTDTSVGVFPTSINELGRTKVFYVDSGAGHHMTWNGTVLFPYPGHLNINSTIRYITGVSGDSLDVGGIGYILSAGGSLDRVLFVPNSVANLVSVSQLSGDYSARVEFYTERVWITRIETGERIGHGYRMGRHYVLDRFEAECLVQQNPV